MEIDYERYAILNGVPPSGDAFKRGGNLDQGTTARMIWRGIECYEQGYIGLKVLFDGGELDSTQIREIAARPDFPKWSTLADQDRLKIERWARRHPVIERVWYIGNHGPDQPETTREVHLAIEMPEKNWYDWHPEYKAKPDLDLSLSAHVEWYRPRAGLEMVEPAVKKYKVMLYFKK